MRDFFCLFFVFFFNDCLKSFKNTMLVPTDTNHSFQQILPVPGKHFAMLCVIIFYVLSDDLAHL